MIEKGYYFESLVETKAHDVYKQIAIEAMNPGIPERMLKGGEVTTSFSSFNGKAIAHICTKCYAEVIYYKGKECCPNRCWGWDANS